MISLILIVMTYFVYPTQTYANMPPVQTVPSVDLPQYLGTWYEIAAIPQFFERHCIGNTTAVYSKAEDGLISVVNSCDTAGGSRSSATGRAKVVDTSSHSKLKVTFVNLFGWRFLLGGDYWIVALAHDYSYAAVGAPGRNYAWILSRTPVMSNAQIREVHQALVAQGFDTCKLISTPQKTGLQTKVPVCQLISEK